MNKIISPILILLLLSSLPAVARTVAILGDSLATGAGTHPALRYSTLALWQAFRGKTSLAVSSDDLPEEWRSLFSSTLPAPRRLWFGSREFRGGPDWIIRNLFGGFSRAYLDSEEYSWGYLLANRRGYDPQNILIAAEDGARTEMIPRQFDRVLDATGGLVPEEIYILFAGNDLCGPALGLLDSPSEYEQTLRQGLHYMLRNGERRGASDVYVFGFLGVLQLLHADSILDRKVVAFGKEQTCKELRKNLYQPKGGVEAGLPPEAWSFAMLMPPNPTRYCPTLFGLGPEREETIPALAGRIREFRAIQRKVVDQLQKQAGSGTIRFHYVGSTEKVRFLGPDIAEDCFHLSIAGQSKVAAAMLAGISEGQPIEPRSEF